MSVNFRVNFDTRVLHSCCTIVIHSFMTIISLCQTKSSKIDKIHGIVFAEKIREYRIASVLDNILQQQDYI